jgi:SAM-dependent methyltransferase
VRCILALSIPKAIFSEYFGPTELFGKSHNGVLNIDLMHTPFDNDAFDYIISTEVFEHIPFPYKAFKETHRILKKGGAHIFTIPYQDKDLDEVRATLDHENKVVHLLEPQYHGDTLRKEEGVLVFTVFSKQMISKLQQIGFTVDVDHRIDYKHGILGHNNIVFTATKL